MKNTIEILLVEDSPSDIRLTEEALKRSELTYNLNTVNDGEQAMEYLEKAKSSGLPDVILLDLNMPKKNGHEVLVDIKNDATLKRIPVVLLTVSQRDEDVQEALRTKMNYYIAKPVTGPKLSAILKSIYQLEKELAKEGSGGSSTGSGSGSGAGANASDEETLIRIVLGGNPHTSETVLVQLARDENHRVRRCVAENPNTPPSVLAALCKDPHAEVRLGLVENPAAAEEIFETLAKDADDDVRVNIAENRKTPIAILEKLAEDENVYVAAQASKTLSELCKK